MRSTTLTGRRVLITGTGGGQGEAAQRLFAEAGARVWGCDITPGAAERTAAELVDRGLDAQGVTVDLGCAEDAARWVDAAAEALGGIDVLYNNAGAARFGGVDELTVDDWDWVIRNELSLVYYATRAAWRHLCASRGTVITTGSVMGMMSHAGIPSVAHSATKGAVIALTRQLAAEGGPFGVRANTISPGFVESPATAASVNPERLGEILAERLMPVATTIDEVARLALFLASDECVTLTGANIVLDGGFTAGRPAVADFRQ